jgi:TolA-binding protein
MPAAMRALAAVHLALALSSTCGVAPPPTAEYREAYDRAARAEREDHPAKAASTYAEAADRASRPRFRWQAAYRQARELEKAGERAAALRLYLSIAEQDPEGEMAPRCIYYAARMAHEDGDLETALSRLRQVIVTYPENGIAPQAVRRAVQWLEDERQQERAMELLGQLAEQMSGTDIGDNLIYHAALLDERRGRWQAALQLYERQVELYPYPGSTLYDDALWRAGNLARGHGEAERALGYLERLVSQRDESWGTGSYYTEWTDDAQLLIGRILLEDLDAPARAARAFETLATFPDSTLADDGLYWASRAYLANGEGQRSCSALLRLLTRFPYSNHQRQARATVGEQGC